MIKNKLVKSLSVVIGLMLVATFQNCSPGEAEDLFSARTPVQIEGAVVVDLTAEEAKLIFESMTDSCDDHATTSETFSILPDGAEITGAGVRFSRINQIESVSSQGIVALFGLSETSLVSKVSGFDGIMGLCGVSVEIIGFNDEGVVSSGNIFVQDGAVNSINGFEGNLGIEGGDYPKDIKQFSGNIVVKTAEGSFKGMTVISQQ